MSMSHPPFIDQGLGAGETPEYPVVEDPQDLAPLVIVEGFLSSTAPFLWGRFEDHLNAQRARLGRPGRRGVIFTSVGPVSSLHDRSCELFYALRGGTVNYGLEHSLEHSHNPLGRTHARGLYPPWSPAHPLHFLGHSVGGPTITTMLTLIREGFFDDDAKMTGVPIDDSMIASVTTVSAPFRGTGIVYDLGSRTGTTSAVQQPSVGSFMMKAVYTLGLLIPESTRLDPHSELRSLSLNDQSFLQYLRRLFKPNGWAESKDTASYDCTFEAAVDRDNRFWRTTENDASPVNVKGKTWIRTYVASMTARKTADQTHHAPEWDQLMEAGPLYFSSSSLGKLNFASIRPLPVFPSARTTSQPTLGERRALTRQTSPHHDPLYSPSPSPTPSTLSSGPSAPSSSSPFELTEATPTPLTPYDPTLPSESTGHDQRSPQPPLLDLDHLPEEYFANDGIVPVFSQWHPGACWPGVRCIHHTRPEPDARVPSGLDRSPDIIPLTALPPTEPPQPSDVSRSRRRPYEGTTGRTREGEVVSDIDKELPQLPHILPTPGIFHVFSLPPSAPPLNIRDSGSSGRGREPEHGGSDEISRYPGQRLQTSERHHHLSVMPLWTGTDRQRLFWEEVGAWLEDVDSARLGASAIE